MSSVVAEVKDFHLVFRISKTGNSSVREQFVKLLSHPVKAAKSEKERLYILRDLNFKVHRGDRIGLLGRNGAGKSSLCRCFTGHFSPTAGTLKVNGKTRGIFDTTVGIYPDLTGRENADILLSFLYPEYTHLKEKMLNDVCEFSQLGSFLDMPFRIYSNGMQARLCLSIVTCQPCDLLILDEVFDGADQFFREKMSQRMLELAYSSSSVIFVSHSTEQVARLCNRVIVLENGSIAYDGPTAGGIAYYGSRGQSVNTRTI